MKENRKHPPHVLKQKKLVKIFKILSQPKKLHKAQPKSFSDRNNKIFWWYLFYKCDYTIPAFLSPPTANATPALIIPRA